MAVSDEHGAAVICKGCSGAEPGAREGSVEADGPSVWGPTHSGGPTVGST